ncbi:MAG TPA: metallophosphatase, partial [Symbiobacteriaceae bacterium]|nr:metallophosphatase [Symbiobacteriaceae bacterium]
MKETLTILHSNDLHSQFEAWVKLEGAAQRLRRELGNDRILRLDAGDFQDRSNTVTEATRGVANMDLLKAAGVDAMTCGNNELLVWPTAHLSHLAASAPFPVLATGLCLAGGRSISGLQETVVLQRSGLKIGLFGLSLNKSRFLEGLGLAQCDPELAAAESVALLRAQGCGLVICLSHLGYDRDRQVAERVAGIDVIVGGHSHTALPQGDRVGDTIIVQAGGFGEYLGRLDLTVSDGVVTEWQG